MKNTQEYKPPNNIIKSYGLFGEECSISVNGKKYNPSWHVTALIIISIALIILNIKGL
jgi:hypothetical protein